MDALAELLGGSPTMQAVRDRLRRIFGRQQAGQRLPPVLLQGETGTGKGLIARLIHRHGARREAPFVDVNCAAIPETLLEAELFGFERGAFTDARRAKPGLFQAAHNGVLFLDEVALLSDAAQAKLLSAIEERAVRRLGSTRREPADVWVISATNADLRGAVRARRFREDLYHRLAVFTLDLPPLRDRGRDILFLAERFLARACAEYGLPPKHLDPAAQARLLAYAWPGNIRELGNVMEQAALLADAAAVTVDSLGSLEGEGGSAAAPRSSSRSPTARDAAQRRELETALEQTGWNISLTAARLGIARNTVYARLERLGLRAESLRTEMASPLRPADVAAAPLSGHTRLFWERRGLTLLRADLCSLDGLDAWSQASRALDAIISKVRSFGGRVEELTPNRLVAVFGLEPTEDAPRRAAHTALAIHKEAERVQASNGAGPGITIGLHVAPLLIGWAGSRIELDASAKRAEWLVLDELMHAREPGDTIASGAAAPFLERRFALTQMDADGERAVYRLTGQERRGLGLWGAMTPFVGRDEELEVLKGRLALAESGRGQVIAVVGDAGVGKSRLFWEILHSHRVHAWLILQSASVSYGTTTAYLPVIELLRGYFEIDSRDDPRKMREKITGKILTLAPTLAPVVPALLALLDVPVHEASWHALDPLQRRQQTLDAVKRLLLTESEAQPLVVVFEDLHWIDGESQALLDSLVESLPAVRLLLLVSYRPEYAHAWGGKTYYRQLRIDPLSPDSAEALLDSLMGEDGTLVPLKKMLIARTEGNPFFLEESVRTLVETRVLVGEQGAYRITKAPESFQIPPTAQAILAARIDRLAPEDKQLLQAASVIGKDVPFALLRAIADMSEDPLRQALSHLQTAELLYETIPFPDFECTFKHALTHEVAYGSVLHERRRDLHTRLVGAIETLHPDRLSEHVERLAHHALRGEVWAKAVAYLRQAAAKAVTRSANREAVNCLEQALGASSHLPEGPETRELAIDLRLDLQVPLNNLGEIERVLDSLREAESLAGALGDLRRTGLVAVYMAFGLWSTGHLDQAAASGERALAIARTLGDVGLEAQANSRIGQAYGTMGEYARAIAAFKRNVDALVGDLQTERFGMPSPPAVMSRTWMGWCLASLGEFSAALAVGEEAVRMAEAADDRFGLALSQLRVGLIHLGQGDAERALPRLELSLDCSRRFSFEILAVYAAHGIGEARAACGDTAAALPLLEEAAERAASIGFARGLPAVLGALGESYLLAGRLAEARLTAGQMLDLTRAKGSRHSEAEALRILAEVRARMDPVEASQAEQLYREALAIAEQLGTRPLAARCRLGLGMLHRATGQQESARHYLATAATMFRQMDMHVWLEQAEAEMRA
ncbi:MAG: hypothetical protein C5B48_16225 [Candidatus Rokuibacteriota bacterium]|nr:MAG: hypothetical protein C5B48_16225 [Candidatus Rokubacteria bacterium]